MQKHNAKSKMGTGGRLGHFGLENDGGGDAVSSV